MKRVMSDTETPTIRHSQSNSNTTVTTTHDSSREGKNSCDVPKLRSGDTEE